MFKHPKIQLLKKPLFLVTLPRLATILFIVLQILGMSSYPGGTMHDETTIGYSFTQNFFSDMGIYEARNGEPNYLSMIIFAFSLALVGITFAIYYIGMPQVFGKDRLNYGLSIIGTIFAFGGSICLVGTGLTPSDLALDPHIFFSNNIFHCFLITALMYTIVIFRSEMIKKRYAIGYGMFFVSIFAYVGVLTYAASPHESQSALVFQVISQKMIVGVFCWSIFYQTFGFAQLDFLKK